MITTSELFNKCSLLVYYVVSCFLSAMPERCVDGLPKRLKNHDKTPSENRFFSSGRSLGRKFANGERFIYNADYQRIIIFALFRGPKMRLSTSPLRCNRIAVTVQSRLHYTVTATPSHRNGKVFWPKPVRRCYQGAPRSLFSALKEPASKC